MRTSLNCRGFLLFLFFSVAVSPVAYAASNISAKHDTHPTTVQDPAELVQVTTVKMLAALKKDSELIKEKPERIYELVYQIVLPHFDFITMSRTVLGKHWKTASKKQKLDFIITFRTLMVRTYATALVDFTDKEIKYFPVRQGANEKYSTVRIEVEKSAGINTVINYKLHLKSKGWKVYDIDVDSISLIGNLKSSYNTEIRKSDLDTLIKRLKQHLEKSS